MHGLARVPGRLREYDALAAHRADGFTERSIHGVQVPMTSMAIVVFAATRTAREDES